MRLTAKEILDKLINDDKILELRGEIKFYLGDVDIVVKQRDVVGNIIQEWLQGWLIKRGIDYSPSANTQMPPDFFLNSDDKTKELLEVKAFNFESNPGFDIADFRVFQEEIIKKPYMLNVDYLIFAYKMSADGVVTISRVWLKKVWEITRCMAKWALNLQVKEGIVHKIRPGVWYAAKAKSYPMFENMEDFLSAIEETVYQNLRQVIGAIVWWKVIKGIMARDWTFRVGMISKRSTKTFINML
jgi:type II restriction enzyme